MKLNVNFDIFEKPPFTLLQLPTYNGNEIEFSLNTTPKNLIGAKDILNLHNKKHKICNEQLLIQIYDIDKQLEPILLEAFLDGSEYIFSTIVPNDSYWRVAFVYTFDLEYENKVRKIEIIDDQGFDNGTIVFLPKGTEYPSFKFLRIKPLTLLTNKIQTLPTDANRYSDSSQNIDEEIEKSRLKYILNYIKNVMKKFNFNTDNYVYPVYTEESALMNSIEDTLIFDNDSGYAIMLDTDGYEYVSGNDYSLAISYDGSRPNVNLREVNVPNTRKIIDEAVRVARLGGGFIEYMWIDPNNIINKYSRRIGYIESYDDFLLIVTSYNPDIGNITDLHLAYVMCDYLQQFIGNFLMYNQKVPSRYQRFYNSIDDGNVTLVDINQDKFIIGPTDTTKLSIAKSIVNEKGGGYIDKNTFCSKIPYYDYIVWYSAN